MSEAVGLGIPGTAGTRVDFVTRLDEIKPASAGEEGTPTKPEKFEILERGMRNLRIISARSELHSMSLYIFLTISYEAISSSVIC